MTDIASGAAPRVWDPLVRLTHWGVAAAVLLNGLLTEGGEGWHVWIGYAAAGLLGLRLIWGLVGTEEARFSAFPPNLKAARGQLDDLIAWRPATAHRSHNPLGALNVYAMWTALAVVVTTGLIMGGEPAEAPEFGAAPFLSLAMADEDADDDDDHEARGAGEAAGHEDENGEEAMEEIHETAANLLLVLAGLHVAGVAVERRRGDKRLIDRMLGRTDGAA